MLRYAFFLLIILHGSLLFAQDRSLPPSISYHIQTLRSYQALPEIPWLLKEGSMPLTIEDLMKGDIKDAAILRDTLNELRLESPGSYWFKLHLHSKVQVKDWLLFVQDTVNRMGWIISYDEVTVYHIDKGQIRDQGRTGSWVPASQRDLPRHNTLALLHLNLQAGEPLDLWVNIRMRQLNPTGTGVFPLPKLSVFDPQVIPPAFSVESYVLSGLKIGILALFGILVLCLFLWTRDKVYGWFLLFLFILFIGEFGVAEADWWTEYIFPEFPKNKMLLGSWITGAIFLSFLQFGRMFVDLSKRHSVRDLWLRRFMWGLGIGRFVDGWYFFFEVADPVAWFLISMVMEISNLGIMLIILSLFFTKNVQAIIFAGCFCILSLGFILGEYWGPSCTSLLLGS